MKMIIVLAALVAVSLAADLPHVVQILRSSFDQKPEGSYNFDFETEDGISRSETGEVKEVLDEDNKPRPVVVVRGTFQYKDADGKIETVSFFADETGYHPEGESIPKAPKPVRR